MPSRGSIQMFPQSAWTLLSPPQRRASTTAKGPKTAGAEGRFSSWGEWGIVCLCSKALKTGLCFLCAIYSFVLHNSTPPQICLQSFLLTFKPIIPLFVSKSNPDTTILPRKPVFKDTPADLHSGGTLPPLQITSGSMATSFLSHCHLAGTSSPHLSACRRVRGVKTVFWICQQLSSWDSQPN